MVISMKKNLVYGILYLTAGILFIGMCFIFPHISLFAGFAGATIGPGLLMIYKHHYWSKRPDEYVEKLESDNIELHDERKEMVRGKTFRVTTLINWTMMSLIIVTIAFLGQFGIIPKDFSNYIVWGISAYWFVNIIILQLVYKHFDNKY